MRTRSDAQLFQDMLDNIARIERYTAGYDFMQFAADEKCQDAVLHCLLRLSEAARLLGERAEAVAPGLPWPQVRGIGNRLRHEYQEVDKAIIWNLIEKDLGTLREAARKGAAVLAAKAKVP